MLFAYLFRNPATWVLPLLIQIVSYAKILKKMGKDPKLGIIPFVGEWAMSKDLLRRIRHFWRPFIFAAVLLITARYLRGGEAAIILKLMAYTVYGLFLTVLYARLAKQFGKKIPFTIALILMPLIFLPVLAFGKSEYLGKREFRPEPERGPLFKALQKIALVLVSGTELAALLAVCFGITVIVRPVRPVAQFMLNDEIKELESVTDSNEYVTRADTMGADYMNTVNTQRSRDYFFPDHTNDKKVVVMEYIIGSNLEDAHGAASVNVAQMIEATEKGEGLEFVIQAGGSERWFTNGIDDSSVGRYRISGGELETAKMLDDGLCMGEEDSLRDFIVWTKENYPADRYMLVLWDHGGGFASGYGVDDLNPRSDGMPIPSSEIVKAVKKAGVRFDLIGFDACLMQDVELANAFEPYADYYLASQETEPALGWFYTAGFSKLAENPAMSTEELGISMVSSYDQLYRKTNDDKPQPNNTLSLVDLTMIDAVHEKMDDLYVDLTAKLRQNRETFMDLSAARSGSYQFYDEQQVDLINYITNLKKADYNENVITDKEADELIDMVNACVVCRNKDSADGINGISIDFPYTTLGSYNDDHAELKKAGYNKQRKFFDNFLSIIASQKKPNIKTASDFWWAVASGTDLFDYTTEDWYIKGYDDYKTADKLIDIPIEPAGEDGDAYLPQLPEKTWDTVLDTQIMPYMVTPEGNMYLGTEHIAGSDAAGHKLITINDKWANISGHLVCYESESSMETDNGIVFKGTVKARLNGLERITLHVEWDPVKADGSKSGSDEAADSSESEKVLTGRVTGYSRDAEKKVLFMNKGLEKLKTGDTIEFMFDYYDDEGRLVKTGAYDSAVHIVSEDALSVTNEAFEAGTELDYYGILTDVYQRNLVTEAINRTVE